MTESRPTTELPTFGDAPKDDQAERDIGPEARLVNQINEVLKDAGLDDEFVLDPRVVRGMIELTIFYEDDEQRQQRSMIESKIEAALGATKERGLLVLPERMGNVETIRVVLEKEQE